MAALTGPNFLTFDSLTVNSTAQAIKATAGTVYGWTIINLHSSAIYIKIYNKAAASVNPASDVPVKRLLVPATSMIHSEPVAAQQSCGTAISVRCVTDSVDTGTTNPATLPIIQIKYY